MIFFITAKMFSHKVKLSDITMDSDEVEALRCIRIAKEAIAAGDKQKALKFLGMAHCLNKYLRLDNLFPACENLDSWSSCRPTHDAKNATNVKADKASANGGWFSRGKKSNTADKASANGGWFSKGEKSNTADKASANGGWFSKGEKSDTKDHTRLVKEIISNKDYYAILGVERNCSVDDIKKAYRKLSLKVHPDKNKAPGAEEAFKKVSVAFKCLSDNESRKQYDQMGSGNEFEHHYQQDLFRRRRRRTWNEYFNDDVEPEEFHRQFFGHSYAFREAHFYRTRTNHAPAHQRKDSHNGLPNTIWWLPLLIFILFASFMFMVPEYSSNRGFSHRIRKTTLNYGVDYFVKSPQFDMKYPMGSPSRTQIENNVINEHRLKLERACDRETSWIPPHRWHYTPRPHCEILESFMA